MQYDRLLLNNLIDSYEKSLLSSGKNKVQIHISMAFSRRNMPEYFDESSMVYEEIHVAANELEKRGFLTIQWKNRKSGTIIEKIILNTEKVDEVYQYLGRTPKADDEKLTREILEDVPRGCMGITENFVHYLLQRLDEGKSVKEYIDISDLVQTRELLRILEAIEGNQKESYIREFSIEHLRDSKKLENMMGLVGKIMCRFGSGYEDMGTEEILAEYQIYHTPNYVYFKGYCYLVKNELEKNRLSGSCFGRREGEKQSNFDVYINLAALQQGIGISGEDIETLCLSGISHIKQVITIENLTTFYRWNEPDSILIYLGGYHNQVRRNLLKMICQQLPQARYLHFGDIDVGGFEIYLDLCRKTGIPFQLYHMGIPELEKYAKYGRKLTENDNRRLDKMIEKLENSENVCCQEIVMVLKYMKITQLKLEQECMNLRDFID